MSVAHIKYLRKWKSIIGNKTFVLSKQIILYILLTLDLLLILFLQRSGSRFRGNSNILARLRTRVGSRTPPTTTTARPVSRRPIKPIKLKHRNRFRSTTLRPTTEENLVASEDNVDQAFTSTLPPQTVGTDDSALLSSVVSYVNYFTLDTNVEDLTTTVPTVSFQLILIIFFINF